MATIRVGNGSGWLTPKNLRVGSSNVKAVKVCVNGAWVNAWSALTASASGGTTSYNLGNGSTPRTRSMSAGATATASSGAGAVTYSWSITGASNVTGQTLSGATSASCSVTATATLNTVGYVYLQCVISDGTSSVVVSATLTFNYYNTV